MMYHRMFGFLGASAAPASAAAGVSALTSTVPFFSSSCIRCSETWILSPIIFVSLPFLVMSKVPEQGIDARTDHFVDDKEVQPEQEHGNDDHSRRGLHFLEGGIVHLH